MQMFDEDLRRAKLNRKELGGKMRLQQAKNDVATAQVDAAQMVYDIAEEIVKAS